MSGLRDLAKGGWHPKGKGEGGKESFRSDFKGINQVAGWMGKGKGQAAEARENHQSAPLSTLKDPSSFGPPPKHVHYHGAAAAGQSSATSSGDTGGLGAPVSRDGSTAKERLQARREAEARAEEEANRPPPGPYRADTTGLSTANLPKPPQFRPGQATPPPAAAGAGAPKPGPPRLPPRLPPRQNSHPDMHAPPPPPSYNESVEAPAPERGILNQGAMNRLGNAGISVPGFGIGRASPPVPPRQNSSSSSAAVSPPPEASGAGAGGSRGPQLSELQSRFSKMSTTSSDSPPPAQGTTWAEKQAALKTASNFRNDPSKVSFSDMRNAASTANNFRERHGEQAAAGVRAANGLNQKYGLADRVNGLSSPTSPTSPVAESSTAAHGAAAAGKKAPPPPPPKKRNLAGNATGANEPPPIPLASKPRF
ncbi:hypothetical protein BU24DRAFT_415347 [Aaosphaeria arxii CBS 175.79]|uniref:Uncharacterized protein n=1 Tax=Aaosphaeria arxii CBS 175.79 TaxID=1450172 RepID=A0A6A5X7Q7_9PLEO|nr:uncharacterized protein BU24DRAFT_415347 [Aaosphaeria arxii CBS 175.79]KAF2008988.1 hypothetical protein BU24DRAFT_415347 [Aaosphaeria arxii CBS 175.79]